MDINIQLYIYTGREGEGRGGEGRGGDFTSHPLPTKQITLFSLALGSLYI